MSETDRLSLVIVGLFLVKVTPLLSLPQVLEGHPIRANDLPMSFFFVTFAPQSTTRCLSKVVMHRTANPLTAVRIRQAPL